MGASTVRADYDGLKQIQQQFKRQSDASAQCLRTMQQAKGALEGGDWIGEGAKAFYREMDSEVLPSWRRLVAALESAALVLSKMAQLIHQAENESAKVFKLRDGTAVAFGTGGTTTPAAATGSINFGTNADQAAVSDHSRQVLQDIMKAAKLDSLTITSTARTPERQALAMYNNLESLGVAKQKALYGPYGDQVIDVYAAEKAAGKSQEQIISAMTAKINEVGPGNVSKHLADPSKINTIDIDPATIADREAFEKAAGADSRVSKVLKPSDNDPAYHLEIPQPQK